MNRILRKKHGSILKQLRLKKKQCCVCKGSGKIWLSCDWHISCDVCGGSGRVAIQEEA